MSNVISYKTFLKKMFEKRFFGKPWTEEDKDEFFLKQIALNHSNSKCKDENCPNS